MIWPTKFPQFRSNLNISYVDNLRVPSGNEKGAWQGLWEPGGFTSGGIPEAVIDPLKPDQYTFSSIYK